MKKSMNTTNSDTSILIAEDSRVQATNLQHLLEENEYQVTVAIDGEEALNIARKQKFNLIISDITMPNMNGYELCYAIKNDPDLKKIPVILLTNLNDPDDIIRGLQSGADNYITKPFTDKYLLARIHQLLINREMQMHNKAELSLDIIFNGQKYKINSERQQILDLLLSIFEAAIEKNEELIKSQEELRLLNCYLEEKVRERTEALIENEKMLNKAQQIAKIGSYCYDPKTKKMKLSDQMFKLLSINPDNFDGSIESAFQNIHPDDIQKIKKINLNVLSDHEPYNTEFRILTPEGGEIIVSGESDSEKDKYGNVQKIIGYIQDVTEKKHTEETLKNSEVRYRRLFEAAKDGIIILDAATGMIMDINPFLIELLGFSFEQFHEKKIWDIGFFKDIIANKANFKELQQKKYIRYEDLPLKTADGKTINVEFVSNVYRMGNLEVIQCNIRDITERKRIENELIKYQEHLEELVKERTEKLEKSEEHYRILFNNVNDAILVNELNENGVMSKFIEVNDVACKIFGYTRIELLKMSVTDINADEIIDAKTINNEMNEKGRSIFKRNIITKDKKIINTEVSAHSFKYDNKILILSIFRDITERIKAEEELNKEKTLLKTIIDTLPDQVYAKDTENKFILTNLNVVHSFGKEKNNELIGKTDFDLLPSKIAKKNYSDEQQILKSGKSFIDMEEHTDNSDEKKIWFSITKVPLIDDKGNIIGLVGINRDITWLKENEEKLQKAKEEADLANQAKSLFLSNMSHEIRTPMNAIMGYSQLMLRDHSLSQQEIDRINIIIKSGEHLLELINDVLEISKIEAGRITFNPSDFDLKSLLHDLEVMFKVKTNAKNLKFLIELDSSLPRYIYTDEGKLRQIFTNIIGNAVKFTNEGQIVVRVYMDRVDNKKNILYTEVEDTGPGITEKEIDNLFFIFGQATSGIKSGGTGLGLALCKHYTKLLGGDITVRSETGKGSCFTFKVSVEESKESAIKQKETKKHVIGLEPEQENYKILIADDNLENRTFIHDLLKIIGFELFEAVNGQDAIDKFLKYSPDIILMDMSMPVLNGYEAIRQIKKMPQGNNIPIIAVTATAFNGDKQKILDTGADGYISKPFIEQELFDSIKKFLGVKYIYEKENQPNNDTQNNVIEEQIKKIPEDLRDKMLEATNKLKLKELLSLIDKLGIQFPEATKYLRDLAKSYKYEILIKIFHRKE